MFTYVTHIG